jgi:hypothetical protein
MHQFDRRACVTCHPAVAPRDHRDEKRVEVNALLRKPILESARPLLVFNPAQDAIAHQLAKPIGQTMRRHAEIVAQGIEPPDSEEGVADNEHRPSIADD